MASVGEDFVPDNAQIPLKSGKPLEDAVTIVIGGKIFSGWESVSISRSIESLANSFTVRLFDKFEGLQASWPLRPGISVKVNIGNRRVLTGRIEKLDCDYAENQRNFTISGRSNTGDLVDCSHIGPAEYKNIGLDRLAEELVKPFGLKVFLSVVPGMVDKFAIKPGESVFEALDRAARLQGFMWVSTRGGNIRLTRANRSRAFSTLVQDVNVLSASAEYDDSKRFSEYTVKGQTVGLPEYFADVAAQAVGSAKDLGVTRYRPLVVVAEGNVDNSRSVTRAQWEASTRLAKAIRVDVKVRGWRQGDGNLWDLNQLTRVKSQFLGLNRDMLISEVTYDKAAKSGGTTTTMTLVDPQSFSLNPDLNKKKESDIFSQLGANFK